MNKTRISVETSSCRKINWISNQFVDKIQRAAVLIHSTDAYTRNRKHNGIFYPSGRLEWARHLDKNVNGTAFSLYLGGTVSRERGIAEMDRPRQRTFDARRWDTNTISCAVPNSGAMAPDRLVHRLGMRDCSMSASWSGINRWKRHENRLGPVRCAALHVLALNQLCCVVYSKLLTIDTDLWSTTFIRATRRWHSFKKYGIICVQQNKHNSPAHSSRGSRIARTLLVQSLRRHALYVWSCSPATQTNERHH